MSTFDLFVFDMVMTCQHLIWPLSISLKALKEADKETNIAHFLNFKNYNHLFKTLGTKSAKHVKMKLFDHLCLKSLIFTIKGKNKKTEK